MKKIIYIFLFLLVMIPFQVKAEKKDNDIGLIENAVSGVLMEASSGQIIYEKEKDKQVAVASMTKMVAQTIILEKIESGQIKWSDIVTVSENASGMGGSQIYLTTGEKMSVEDLFKGISMASANDAVVAMAEYISGSEKAFVKLMNKKVKELGLKNTVFKNSTGLDEEGHYSSAYDMAIIAKNLLSHQDILKFSSVYEDYLRQNTDNKFWLVNTNKLVRFYEGADGLKTGHTDAAKYCLAATAKKDNMRLIAIVLGEEESKVRNSETMQLLDYGFNTKKVSLLKKKDEVIEEIKFDKGNKEKIAIMPREDVGVLEDKQDNGKSYKYDVKINELELPIKKGDVVGTISVIHNNKKVTTVDLVTSTNVEKLNYLELYIQTIKNSILGIIN